MRNTHKNAIVKALRGKGFSKRHATNIAKVTLKKSIQSTGYMTNWNESICAELKAASKARENIYRLHQQAAINKPSTMAGKIVVVPPKQ